MTDPSYSYGTPPAPERTEPPAPVRNAVKLMISVAVLSVISLITVLASKDAIRDQIRASDPTADLDAVVNVAITVGILFAVVYTVLYLLLARMVLRGKGWARIVTFVLAGFGILGGLANLAGATATTANRIIGVLSLVLDIGIVVLLGRKESGAYFARAEGGYAAPHV